MKKRLIHPLYATLTFAFMLMMAGGHLLAQSFQHPKDQIALQLGAIQMGYTVPFTLTGNISVPKMQQAVNALVMGRNALDATVAKPAVQVVGAVDSPSVDTVEYRDQLYAAVEYVVTSPVLATIKGSATLMGNKKVSVAATKLTVPTNAWTIPVPYALESRSSADISQVVDVLVSAGLMSPDFSPSMIAVAGGTLPQSSDLAGQVVTSFQIGKYEVTWGEWKSVSDWAVGQGYTELANIGDGNSNQNPVTFVSWYDVVKWCNAKSEKEGLTPVYTANGTTYKTGESVPTVNSTATGYRLPSEKEWEWAAIGGVSSQGYTYSGSNKPSEVAWTPDNSSGGSKVVGTKAANELGIYDMSGNVWEWCEYVDYLGVSYRRIRGGSWSNVGPDFGPVAFNHVYADSTYAVGTVGFRLARSSGN